MAAPGSVLEPRLSEGRLARWQRSRAPPRQPVRVARARAATSRGAGPFSRPGRGPPDLIRERSGRSDVRVAGRRLGGVPTGLFFSASDPRRPEELPAGSASQPARQSRKSRGLWRRRCNPCRGDRPKSSGISFPTRPQIRRDYPLNLSILLSGGKETNKDSLSNGE